MTCGEYAEPPMEDAVTSTWNWVMPPTEGDLTTIVLLVRCTNAE